VINGVFAVCSAGVGDGDRANALKISEDSPPQKGAKKRKKEDLPAK
jgi:hypothetical protein